MYIEFWGSKWWCKNLYINKAVFDWGETINIPQ